MTVFYFIKHGFYFSDELMSAWAALILTQSQRRGLMAFKLKSVWAALILTQSQRRGLKAFNSFHL